jgi:hypothetical protein
VRRTDSPAEWVAWAPLTHAGCERPPHPARRRHVRVRPRSGARWGCGRPRVRSGAVGGLGNPDARPLLRVRGAGGHVGSGKRAVGTGAAVETPPHRRPHARS